MKTLPSVGELVVVNNLSDAVFYRVVTTDGKFGVGLIDSTIEKQVINQPVQWLDVCYLKYPTKKQLRYQEAVKKCNEMDKWAKSFAAEIMA